MKRSLYLIGLIFIGLAILSAPVWAGESVVLRNGFRLHADRHEISGDVVRIYSGGGMTEMASTAVSAFEPEETVSIPAVASATPAVKPPAVKTGEMGNPPQELAAEAARKFDLPESFVRSVMHAESNFRPDAVSPKGATGLMQLMPGTARELGVDPKNPRENTEGGTAFLRQLLALYENRPDQVLLALAAYNAGPAAVERWHGVPPYRETREYILRVLSDWKSQPDNANSGK